MKRTILIAALVIALALQACFSCRRDRVVYRESVERQVIVSASFTLPDEIWGLTHMVDGEVTGIEIRGDLDVDLIVSVIVHELWHAAGYTGHQEDGSYSSSGCGGRRYPQPPTIREVEQMREAAKRGQWRVSTGHAGMVIPLAYAVQFWNRHVGRRMFVGP